MHLGFAGGHGPFRQCILSDRHFCPEGHGGTHSVLSETHVGSGSHGGAKHWTVCITHRFPTGHSCPLHDG
ncbi:hypothetical protein PENTCL1PPCAC_30150 [Pristionchus entomophagus]|uniref:Uncharacterized protein n=1 Tax=Pristionchus entomophagus TaxID=358040 RepID=A0AAV5UNW6_9BILA|nr:hypothetical protein PENTCL1PPCAC_30150 [Pristionchus entomophagus]